MANFTAVPMFFLILVFFAIKFHSIRAATLLVKETDENIRSKHMVKYHHTIRGEYPYSLSLQVLKHDKFVHICGATLLNVQDTMLAVTSASCLEDNDPEGNSSLSLVAGVVQSNRTEYQQRRSVCKRVVHEEYLNNSMDPVHPRKYDIALLFINLRGPFEIGFKINVYPIQLPSSKEQVIEEPLIAIGWEKDDSGYFISHVFETPALTRKQCVDDFYLQARAACLVGLHVSHICAANEEPFEGGTQSRGSPILPKTERYLAAIWSESYSKGSDICGPHPTPAIYTSIPYHRDWVNRQVEGHNKMYKVDHENPKFICD